MGDPPPPPPSQAIYYYSSYDVNFAMEIVQMRLN